MAKERQPVPIGSRKKKHKPGTPVAMGKCGGCGRPFLFHNDGTPQPRLTITYYDSQQEHTVLASSNPALIDALLVQAEIFFNESDRQGAGAQVAEARHQLQELRGMVNALTGRAASNLPEDQPADDQR